MRRTGLSFLAAVGVFAAVLLVPRDERELLERLTQPLDLVGIEEVEVVSPVEVSVVFAGDNSPRLDYRAGNAQDVVVTREGHRLRIVSQMKRGEELGIRLAPSVHKLGVHNAVVGTEVRLETLAIQVSGTLSWTGNARKLTVVDVKPASEVRRTPRGAADGLRFYSGRIDHLAVTTRGSRVGLYRADSIGKATLTLGRKAAFSIDGASRIPDITLLPHPAETQAPEAKTP